MELRTRMAPSPTGEYHIGHIRTVLYNYALARKNKGKFVIRIEDTDRERFVEGATDRILDVIKDYGLNWDEGPRVGGEYGPYIQSARLDIYQKYIKELLLKGKAYHCFCTQDRLTQMRDAQKAGGSPVTKYDRFCLNLSENEIKEKLEKKLPYVVRLKVPDNRDILFNDEILGEIKINTSDIDDQVLMKSDGFPTYHFAVVVDDYLMQITHIMRGSDWIASTPKHVLLYEAFGWELPKYIHLPNLKELGGSKKLSKRFGAVAAIEFLQEGYLPRALLNFLMFLGWNPGTEQELFTLEEFINLFSLDRLQKTDLVSFDRTKLAWFNAHYIRETDTEVLLHELKMWAKKFGFPLNTGAHNDEFNVKVLNLVKDRMKVLSDFNLLTGYFYDFPKLDKEKLYSHVSDKVRGRHVLLGLLDLYNGIENKDWTTEYLDQLSHDFISKKEYKPKEAFMTLRLAVTGESATPPIFEIISLLGKDTTIKRLEFSLS